MFTVLPPLVMPYGLPRASCSVLFMNENVSAPMDVAAAMLIVAVTAMSMSEATTGLRAFRLLNVFFFLFCLKIDTLFCGFLSVLFQLF